MTLFLTTATITSAYAQNATSATMGFYYDRVTGLYYDIPLQGDYCLDSNEDKICDVDFHDGKVVVYGPDVVTKQTSINAMAQLDERQKELIRGANNNDNDNNDNENDDDDNDNNDDDDSGTKYCDGQAAPKYPDSCYDRNDLPEDSGYDDDDNDNNDNDNDNNDEETSNCGGESCTATEKEDSWTDEEAPDEGGN
jgi:hypothetical protein